MIAKQRHASLVRTASYLQQGCLLEVSNPTLSLLRVSHHKCLLCLRWRFPQPAMKRHEHHRTSRCNCQQSHHCVRSRSANIAHVCRQGTATKEGLRDQMIATCRELSLSTLELLRSTTYGFRFSCRNGLSFQSCIHRPGPDPEASSPPDGSVEGSAQSRACTTPVCTLNIASTYMPGPDCLSGQEWRAPVCVRMCSGDNVVQVSEITQAT